MAESFRTAMTTSMERAKDEKWCSEFIGEVKALLCKNKVKLRPDQSFYRYTADSLHPPSFLSTESVDSKKIPYKHMSLRKMESFTVTIAGDGEGFGFRVKGSCPVRVAKVKAGSAADIAGLRVGDCIGRIGGTNVSRSSKESIVKMIRQSEKLLRVEVHRRPPGSCRPAHVARRQPLSSSVAELPYRPSHHASSQLFQCDPLLSDISGSQCGARGLCAEQLRVSCTEVTEVSSVEVNCTEDTELLESELTGDPQDSARDRAIADILSRERQFVIEMHDGLQNFSEVIRSEKQHATLFHKVQQLVALSAYQVSKLSTAEDVKKHLGPAYLKKVEMMCATYLHYSEELPVITRLITDQNSHGLQDESSCSLNNTELQLSILLFLNIPLQHVQSLLAGFQRVLLYTTPEHPHHMDILQVVSALEDLCLHHLEPCGVSLLSAISDSTLPSGEAFSQLSRTQALQPFLDATLDRGVIYCDEVTLAGGTGGAPCQRLQLRLYDDSLLLAVRSGETGGVLEAVAGPIRLADITATDFNCHNDADFTLWCQQTPDSTAGHLTLRATSAQSKCAWKVILEHQTQVAAGDTPWSSVII